MEICLAGFVNLVPVVKSMTVKNEAFGVFKQAHFGEATANSHISQKSML